MSTATFPSMNPINLSATQVRPFANEVSALYGAIPNGTTRVLCPSDPGSTTVNAPVFPKSARGYQRTHDLNAAGDQWRQTLASARHIAVWDIPTTLWEQRYRVPMAWADHFRGVVTTLRYEPQPQRDPHQRARPPIAEVASEPSSAMQGASPYQHYKWFAVQRKTSDPRQVALRKIYPRAYESWSEEEKLEMQKRIQNGDSFDLVAHDLRRQPEAVSVAVWRLSEELAEEMGIPRPEKLQLASSGSGLTEESKAPSTTQPLVKGGHDKSDLIMGSKESHEFYPSDYNPKPNVINFASDAQSKQAQGISIPPPIMMSAEADHDPTPCEYMQRVYRQMPARPPNTIMRPDDFPPLLPEPQAAALRVTVDQAVPRRASPTAVFAMAQSVRQSLKAQGVGTKQISLIADVLRQVQES